MSEVRLIDANALKELFLKTCGCDCYLCKNYYYDRQIEKAYCHLIDNAPTVDTLSLVISGRHYGKTQALLDALRPKGKWEKISDGHGHSSYFCSRCGTQEGKPYAFCPNCGADMRSVDEGLRERAMSDLSKVVGDAYKKARGDV